MFCASIIAAQCTTFRHFSYFNRRTRTTIKKWHCDTALHVVKAVKQFNFTHDPVATPLARLLWVLGFPTRFLPKPKNRVTRSFFKTEKPVLAACKPVFFGFEF